MRIIRTGKVIHPELSYKINGILFKVRKELGWHKNEKQYCDAIERELAREGIHYEREKVLDISFDNEKQGRNKADFIVERRIVLEIKAKAFITKDDYHQLKRYLEALNIKLGILVNMRRYYINPKRVLNSKGTI